MARKKILLVGSCRLLILVLFALASLVSSDKAAAKEPIKIGALGPITGPMSNYGIPTKAGLEILAEGINAKGGILGRPVKIIFRDSKLNPEVTVREVKDLVYSENCRFVGGCTSSGCCLAASAAVKAMRGETFWMGYCCTADKITEEKGHRYVFRADTNTQGWMRGVAIGAADMWGATAKRIYIISPDYVYGHCCVDEFLDVYLKRVPDAKVVGESWFPLGSKDYTAYITAILAAKPDLVYSPIYGGDALIFFKQAEPYGLLEKVHFVAECVPLMECVTNLRKGDAGVPIGVFGDSVNPFWAMPKDSEAVKYSLAVYKRCGVYPGLMASNAWVYMAFMKAAIEKAGSTDVEKVIDALEGLTVNTPWGDIHMRACDHQPMYPVYTGTLGWDPTGKWPMPIMLPETVKRWDDYASMYHSCEEIKAIRAGAKK
jgi:branched-chain amino acid transport system substrate-binding protein